MRGGSAPSWRQAQGLCPAGKAETAARCGFTVPVLEGARLLLIGECTLYRPSSSRAPGAQPENARQFESLAAARALRSTRVGRSVALGLISPTGPGRTQLGGNAFETSPPGLRSGRVRSNLSDILDNDKPQGPALARPNGYRLTGMSA